MSQNWRNHAAALTRGTVRNATRRRPRRAITIASPNPAARIANRVCSQGNPASTAETATRCRVGTVDPCFANATSNHTPAALPTAAGLSGNTITPSSTVVADPMTPAQANHAAPVFSVASHASRHTSAAVIINTIRIVACAPCRPKAAYAGNTSADTPGA